MSQPIDYYGEPTGPLGTSKLAIGAMSLSIYAVVGLLTFWVGYERFFPRMTGWTHPVAMLCLSVMIAWLGGVVLSIVSLFHRHRPRRVAAIALLLCVSLVAFWIIAVQMQSPPPPPQPARLSVSQ